MSADQNFRSQVFTPAVPGFALLVLLAVATGDAAQATTVQQCNAQYARCLNRAIETGRGDKTLVNCDTMAGHCLNHASDRGNYTTIVMRKGQQQLQAGKFKALELGKTPAIQGGGVKRR
jgi:hypothetical protein